METYECSWFTGKVENGKMSLTCDGVEIFKSSRVSEFQSDCNWLNKKLTEQFAEQDHKIYMSPYYYHDTLEKNDRSLIMTYSNNQKVPYINSDNLLLTGDPFKEDGCKVLNFWLNRFGIRVEPTKQFAYDRLNIYYNNEEFRCYEYGNEVQLNGMKPVKIYRNKLSHVAVYIYTCLSFYRDMLKQGLPEMIRVQSHKRRKLADVQLTVAKTVWEELGLPGVLDVDLHHTNTFHVNYNDYLKFDIDINTTISELRQNIYNLACTIVLCADNPYLRIGAARSRAIRKDSQKIAPHLKEFKKKYRLKDPWEK
ncbi:MAG: hypothetical protein MJZ34_02220 [Paludibacteraceae bacterium]|nr:hypothetical protein [Paludibacteraceae bacterium]